jgi:hypothetical protein
MGYAESMLSVEEACKSYPDYYDLKKIPVDYVCFSEGHPLVLFVNVDDFSPETMERLAGVQKQAWNYRMVQLLMVASDTEIRIYNCFAQPQKFSSEDQDSASLKYAEVYSQEVDENTDVLASLLKLFTIENVNNGSTWKNVEIRKKLDQRNRVDIFLIDCLHRATIALRSKGLSDNVIHALLIRSLFILFLEDKGAAREAGLYEKIKPGSQSYFDILEDKDATYLLFSKVNEHFNGNITPLAKGELKSVESCHLQIVKHCFFDGNIENRSQLFTFRLFNFEVIRIEVLSEIYEHFLGETKKVRGQYYTPAILVHLMLNDTLQIKSATGIKKILDPACGSGIFLVEAFKHLIKIYKLLHNNDRLTFDQLCQLLLENIYGIDIDLTAIKVAAFSLYLALIDELDPRTLWIHDDYHLPYLVDYDDLPEDHRGHNLLCKNAISEVEPEDLPHIDLLIGNPPYGSNNLPEEIRIYCNQHKFAAEQILPFMHKATLFCPDGQIALVFNTKVLTNTNGKFCNFRKWFFENTCVETIYNLSILRKSPHTFGGNLFAKAVVPVAVAYYRASLPENPSKTLKYLAPKTYVKSSMFEGVVFDSTDVKYIPIDLVRKGFHVWKAFMWGNYKSYLLLRKLMTKKTIKNWADEKGWIYGKGVNRDSKRLTFTPSKLIDISKVQRYYTLASVCTVNNNKRYRGIDDRLVHSPYVLFNQGIHNNQILCSLIEGDGYFTTTAFSINGNGNDYKKILVSFYNSTLAKFLLFLSTSSWGIERNTIMMEEALSLPSPFVGGESDILKQIISLYDEILETHNRNFMTSTSDIERQLDKLFYKLFHLTEDEVRQIEDVLKYSVDFFAEQESSAAIMTTNRTIMEEYAFYMEKTMSHFLSNISLKCKVTVFNAKFDQPLTLAILQFGENACIECNEVKSDMRTLLKDLNAQLLIEKTDNILLQRDVKFYDNDKVYILKRNQRRYWTRSQAIDDASIIISEILNVKTR